MRLIPAFALLSLVIVLAACGKDKFQTKPLIEVREYNSKVIPRNGTLIIRLNYYDKEGDLGEGRFYAFRQRLNILPPNIPRPDVLEYALPKFNNKDRGEITIQLDEFNFLSESSIQNDTMVFKIAVTDRAGNTSDTITTDRIVVTLP